MDTRAAHRDRLKRPFATHRYRAIGASIAYLLSPRTPEEHEQRRAHLFALLLVALVATVTHVIGLTEDSAAFTVHLLVIVVIALRSGFAPACVATLAAVLLVDAHGPSAVGSTRRIVFALEGLGVAVLAGATIRRLREADARLRTTQAANDELRAQVRRGHVVYRALQHLEEMAPDAAVFVVNAQGLIVEWPRNAERMYGYATEQIVGSSMETVVSGAVAMTDVGTRLRATTHPEARRPGVHRRSDGSRVHVELEVKACRPQVPELFTVGVCDLSRQRETEAFREAALRAQAALQQTADDARHQLAGLESLTDPSVNPVAGGGAVGELIERLRSTIGADGVAVVQLGRTGTRIVAGAGLRPAGVRASGAAGGSGAPDGRVAFIHNDAARVAQVSALTWPRTVSSIMVVPVCHTGQAAVTIEVVNERRAAATEWHLALARIVADRLAQAIAPQVPADANAVA